MLRASFRPGLFILFVSVGFLLHPAARAQSLGEAAQREKARRQAAPPKKPVRTFGDADLPPRVSGEGTAEEGTSGAASFTPSTPPQAKADGPSPSGVSPSGLPDDPEARRQLERTWKARFVEARANFRAADARAWRMKTDVVWRGGMPYQVEVREKVETEELVQARQALEELEEEFRRTGLPAGWSRD